MERIAILIGSSPTSAGARRAVDLAASLAERGHPVTVALVEDGVLAAVAGSPVALPAGRFESVLALEDDLALRGFAGAPLVPGCRRCTYGDLVDLMMEQVDRTLGVF